MNAVRMIAHLIMGLLWLVSGALTVVSDPNLQAELDVTARPRLIDTHFSRYGPVAARNVSRDPRGVRIRLPATGRLASQSGLYSYFAVAGNFELTVDYDLINLPKPESGYGSAVGISLDAENISDGSLSLFRGIHPQQGPAYWVTRAKPGDNGTTYETSFYPCSAKSGKLGFRREKDAIVCMAADSIRFEPRELITIPFVAGAIRPIRLFADSGGSPTAMDVRLTNFRLRAQEITGGIPEIGNSSIAYIGWILAGVAGILGLSGLLWQLRVRSRAI
jgi:hypothetical protein